jgi:arsenate reductase (thioredoxin)
MARVLFVCLHNAGRSQMSQALFERAASGRHEAASAGTTPGNQVHPEVVEVMRELNVELEHRVPRPLTNDLARWADVIVTMGCGDECPYVPGKRYLDWDLPDPKGRPLGEVRATRDEIALRVSHLLDDLEAGGVRYNRGVTADRAVPNIKSDRPEETRDFFTELLGFEVAMDMDWVVTLASPDNPSVQVTVIANDDMAAPGISVGVPDVDAVHAAAVERDLEIAYPLRDEEWGVRRFMLREPSGTLVNVVSHRPG